ncbi:MAG TPA: YceI family protein [Thermoanaerobaculia bacterium]|nr:YceI family protein [Thermoanaerobaculia bacterium]
MKSSTSTRVMLTVFACLILAACGREASDTAPAQVGEPMQPTATASESKVSGPVIRERSSIRFIGANVLLEEHGEFTEFDGSIEYVDGRPAGVHFEIAPGSASTGKERLNQHLRSGDFFESEKYPKATFHSTSIAPAAGATPDAATHTISGELTLKGVTRPVTFPARAELTADGVHVTSEFRINRHDWNVSYRGAPDNLIRDDVVIRLDLMFPSPPAAV